MSHTPASVRSEYRHVCGAHIVLSGGDPLLQECSSCGRNVGTWQLVRSWDSQTGRDIVTPEGAREHAANALMALTAYREAHGLGWHQVLSGSVQIAELSALLESVEARLRLAVAK